MPNMRDVAERAGVGVGTVSRALSGRGYVSEETEQRIQQAIKELEYVPKTVQRPAARRTGLIGVTIPDIEQPFFSKLMRYFDSEISRRGYKTVFCNTISILNRQAELLEMLERQEIDGLIVCGDAPSGFQNKEGRPIVSFDRFWNEDVGYVHSDHETGGKIAANIFLRHGCRRVVQFTGGSDLNLDFNQRHGSMERTLKAQGCEVININMEWNGLSYVYNKQIMQKYWDIIKSADGCLMNDIGAVSCLTMANEKGLKVPEDLRIIAYDGSELTNLTTPEVSVIQQDCGAIAEACMSMLLEMIDGKHPADMCRKIPVISIERGTT